MKRQRSGEGALLQAVLKRHGRRPADLARALGYHPSAVTRYMNVEKFDIGMWRSIRRGLTTMIIDPSQIRQTEPTMPRNAEDILKRVHYFVQGVAIGELTKEQALDRIASLVGGV